MQQDPLVLQGLMVQKEQRVHLEQLDFPVSREQLEPQVQRGRQVRQGELDCKDLVAAQE